MNELIAISADITANRRLIKLKKEIIDARKRWKITVQENSVVTRMTQGESNRSPLKVLYIALYGAWWDRMKKEVTALQAKIKKAGYVGSKKPRSIWLPTTIEYPITIALKIYQARSVLAINYHQAIGFSRRADCHVEISKEKLYKIESITGLSYTLRATHESYNRDYAFSEWAVCVCHDSSHLPRLNKKPDQLSKLDQEFEGAHCTYKKRALYVIEQDSPPKASDDKPEDDNDAEWGG